MRTGSKTGFEFLVSRETVLKSNLQTAFELLNTWKQLVLESVLRSINIGAVRMGSGANKY